MSNMDRLGYCLICLDRVKDIVGIAKVETFKVELVIKNSSSFSILVSDEESGAIWRSEEFSSSVAMFLAWHEIGSKALEYVRESLAQKSHV